MKIAEEQKKPFIVLCCLIVFVLAYAGFRIVGSSSHAQTRQTQSVAERSDKSTEAERQPDVQPAGELVVVSPDATNDLTARDPFIPQVSDGTASARMPVNRTSFPPIMTPGKMPGLGALMPPMSFDREITVVPGGGPAAESEPDPSQMLKLTGIIQGSINVAIIRGSDNSRYIVREGQLIDGKYRVDLVTRYGVRISHNNKSYLLSLGGSDANKGAQ